MTVWRTNIPLRLRSQTRNAQTLLLTVLAVVIIIELLALFIYWWPFPYLGYSFDPGTGQLTSIEPHSSAAESGLQVGDRLLKVYGLSWRAVVHHWNVLDLAGSLSHPIPIQVERDGQVLAFSLTQQLPTLVFQSVKATTFVLALVCWLTGYVLCIVRRHEVIAAPIIGMFWMLFGGIFAGFIFARYASIPLMVVLEWVMLTILLPLAVYIHVWFPARPVAAHTASRSRRYLFISSAGLNIALLCYMLSARPPLLTLANTLGNLLLLGLAGTCIMCGLLLWQAHRHTTIAHTRRQIWLIALSCFVVATAWFCFLIAPVFTRALPVLADRWIDLVMILIPAAYLIGGVVPDLYHVDRLLSRAAALMSSVAITLLTVLLISQLWTLDPLNIALLMTLGVTLLYKPLYRLAVLLLPDQIASGGIYRSLRGATSKLTTSLETNQLVEIVQQGLCCAFHEPAFAMYMRDSGTANLSCKSAMRMPYLPATLPGGVLAEAVTLAQRILETTQLRQQLIGYTLTYDEAATLHHPDIALWCPVLNSEGALIAVVLLGYDGMLDPYRTRDFLEIQRFMDAASLALNNSAIYQQQCEAETTVRHLYQELQHTQEKTAMAIARELHDEVINVHVRLNMQSLKHLTEVVDNDAVRSELETVLESERTVCAVLRMVCEELHPTASADAFGLPNRLRIEVDRTQAEWAGKCDLFIINEPSPISADTQRSVLRIAREAMVNAVKHAEASTITITLRYPPSPGEQAALVVEDNGRTSRQITPRPGHWGIRNMQESARAVDGIVGFSSTIEGGTTMTFSFPLLNAEEYQVH